MTKLTARINRYRTYETRSRIPPIFNIYILQFKRVRQRSIGRSKAVDRFKFLTTFFRLQCCYTGYVPTVIKWITIIALISGVRIPYRLTLSYNRWWKKDGVLYNGRKSICNFFKQFFFFLSRILWISLHKYWTGRVNDPLLICFHPEIQRSVVHLDNFIWSYINLKMYLTILSRYFFSYIVIFMLVGHYVQ